MPVKVLIVDDSSFFRRRVSEILAADSDIEVIDTAVNGADAVTKAAALRPDVITMDVEMPVLDGISAVKQIMAKTPTPILMFSSLTREGASATLDALDAGALDFLPKKFEDIARNNDEAVAVLQRKVKELGRRRLMRWRRPPLATTASASATATATSTATTALRSGARSGSAPAPAVTAQPKVQNEPGLSPHPRPTSYRATGKNYRLVVIGTSTGGPVALQSILTQLPRNFSLPILLVQHMPSAFTPAFAQRLNNLCNIEVKEAEQGDMLKPGTAYLAPGGQQMMFDPRATSPRLKVFADDNPRITYKPSVDVTFASSAKQFGGDVLAIVLTGMGADGREGARMLKQYGARVWAQDEESCVVYGMPQAIVSAGLHDHQLALEDVASHLIKEVGNG
ncbi:chemotaxis response regulator protein-glutamate methylesterase [Pseudoalteromonas sp. BDTF-M6]|uniref:protein-glutamate methylesterase/protein-glutamine glutaminase n=1 Tax=Pseudoalteromonas sp. BDTF-M6 TaxID=2796132 RepID=UPI001BAE8072|nr:chemotaxis response regulator protein-glutamate methylesterase [Pseudoalteromonas sp. BDTF-M6]MBS3798829.1 chemotaxis response regulator protein-glutamate methylesterase [Pseudoalteromonas sp. BDTF-M6]